MLGGSSVCVSLGYVPEPDDDIVSGKPVGQLG